MFSFKIGDLLLGIAASIIAASVVSVATTGTIGRGDMIAVAVSVGLIVIYLVGWNRHQRAAMKPGMASWWFIAASFGIALLAVGAGMYGLGLRATAPHEVSANPAPLLVDNLKIVRSGDPDALFVAYGTFSRSGTTVRVYVDFDFANHDTVKRGNDSTVSYPRRVKLREFTNFAVGEEFKVTVASYDPPTTTVVLRWGMSTYGVSEEADRFSWSDPIDARLVITDEKGKKLQSPYSFWLRPKITGDQIISTQGPKQFAPKTDASNLLLFTESMNTQAKWK